MATVLQRTGSGAYYGKMTISFWVKRSKLGEQGIFGRREGSATANLSTSHFTSADQLLINFRDGGGNSKYYMITNRVFKDVNAWYHIVYAIDGTHATASERSKLYVNGVRETSFSLLNNPSSTGYEVNMFVGGGGNPTYIGRGLRSQTDGWLTFEGCMSHFHCATGYTYDASVFGSTDSATGEWNIITAPTFTPGTDGFTIMKDGNTITDQSANSNDFTVYSGTLTKTQDNPSNVFATMNPLNVPASNPPTFANGNTTVTSSTNGASKFGGNSTLGMVTGKYYCEAKATVDGSYSRNVIGVTGDAQNTARNSGSILGSDQASSGYYSADGTVKYNANTAYTGSSYVTGDIIQVAIDLDNNRLFYGKNGTWQNSGNPTTSSGAISIAAGSATNDGAYFFANSDDTGTAAPSKFEFNFGNGYFGTTAVSSAGTNASGLGIFEYDVPAGYTALCTKGLNL